MSILRWITIGAVTLTALCASHAPAQVQARPARIAVVAGENEAATRAILDAFRAGLLEYGQIEGRTYVLDIRYAEGRLDRFPELVAGAISRDADVIVVGSYPGILAAKQATRKVPIAGYSCGLELFVDSLARPGGNLTGVTCQSSELGAKQFQLLREILPAVKRIAVLSNPSAPYSEPAVRELRSAGSMLGIRMIEIAVRSPADFGRAVEQMHQASAEAVVLTPDTMLFYNRAQLADLLLANRLPTMGFFPEFVDAGALLSYSSNREERYHRLAWYVDRILKGTKPAELPVDQPTKFELVVNLRTAKALGITIPQSVLLRADRKVE